MKSFLRFFSERFLDQRVASAEAQPMAVLARQERESPAAAASGARMAVNNCLEISSTWPLSQIVTLDAEMHAKGVLTLSHVRSRLWGRYTAMMRRARIQTAAELATAQAVLADRSLVQSLPDVERQSLVAMVAAYSPARTPPSIDRARPGRPKRGFRHRP
jgi:hypothetical protein